MVHVPQVMASPSYIESCGECLPCPIMNDCLTIVHPFSDPTEQRYHGPRAPCQNLLKSIPAPSAGPYIIISAEGLVS